jgi:Flp pilus assembly protein TadD
MDIPGQIERGAVDMDPNFVPAHLVLGQAYEQSGMLGQAIAEFETAVRMSGGGALYLSSLAHAYALAGRRTEAEQRRRDLRRLSEQRFISFV